MSGGQMETVVAYLQAHAQQVPNKAAVIVNGEATSYGQLDMFVRGYASFLKKLGLEKGQILVVKSSQSLEYVVAYLGIHLAGGIIAAAEKNVPAEGLSAMAKKLSASFIISGDKLDCADVAWVDGSHILEDARSAPPMDLPLPQGTDSADILFTTGTTGSSKGVELSHKALVATAENLIYGCGYREDTLIVVPGPLNHANPIRKLITTIVNGSTIYLLNGMMNLKAFYTALDDTRGRTACCLPPAMIRTIFSLTGDTIGNYADKIDFIESATAPLPEPDKLRLCQLLPHTRLFNNYGSSEAASVCMYDYNANPGKTSCIGKVMRNSQILIVNDDREVIASSKDQMGCLACAGGTVMKGYVNEPELTREVLVDGVVYTNDVGYIDEEGFVYITGRKDDVINVGGLKVAPAEVEEAALAMEGVDDCICIAMPHPISGQALKLLVVMKENAELSPRKFSAFLQTKLEGYKIPTKYEQVDSVARTYNGKLDRKAYR